MHANTTGRRDHGGAGPTTGRSDPAAPAGATAVAAGLALAMVGRLLDRTPRATATTPSPTFRAGERRRRSRSRSRWPTPPTCWPRGPDGGDVDDRRIGLLDPDDGAASATVWTSDDGRELGATETSVPARTGRDVRLDGAAAPGRRRACVAVGGRGDGDEADAAVWRQDERRVGRRRSPEVMAGEHEQWAFDVAAGAGGHRGGRRRERVGRGPPPPVVSADGETWSRVDGGAGGVFDATGEEAVRAVAASATGSSPSGSRTLDGEQDGVAWYSADGETWEAVDAPGPGRRWRQDVLSGGRHRRRASSPAACPTATATARAMPVVVALARRRGRGARAPAPLADADGPQQAARDLAVRSSSRSDGRPHRRRRQRLAPPDVAVHRRRRDLGEGCANPVHGDLFQDGVTLGAPRLAERRHGVAIGAEPSVLMLAGTRWEDVTADAFPRGARSRSPRRSPAGAGRDDRRRRAGHAPPGRRTARARRPALAAAATAAGRRSTARNLHRGPRAGRRRRSPAASSPSAWRTSGSPPGAGHRHRRPARRAGVGVAQRQRRGAASAPGRPHRRGRALEYLENPSARGWRRDRRSWSGGPPPVSVAPAGGAGHPVARGRRAFGRTATSRSASCCTTASDGRADHARVARRHHGSSRSEPPAQRAGRPALNDDVCVGADDTAVVVGVSGGDRGPTTDLPAPAPPAGGWRATVPGSAGRGNQQAYGCTAGDDGFVIVGSDDRSGNRDARVWTSADGVDLGRGRIQLARRQRRPVGQRGGGRARRRLARGRDRHGPGRRRHRPVAHRCRRRRAPTTTRDETALRGPGEQSVTNVAVDDDGHVTLAGNDYGRVGLWQSDTVDR